MSFISDISLKCPKCQKQIEAIVNVPSINFTRIEKLSEIYEEDEIHFECNHCKHPFIGQITLSNIDHCTAYLPEYDNVTISCSHAYDPEAMIDFDDWYEYEHNLQNPYFVFNDQISTLDDLLDTLKDLPLKVQETQKRMILSHTVSILEAYLSDNIKVIIANDLEKQIQLILKKSRRDGKDRILKYLFYFHKNNNVNKEKYSEDVRREAFNIINNIVFHNIQDIENIYKITTDIDEIITKTKCKKEFIELIKKRHDCIHRNGNDKDGNKIIIASQELALNINLVKKIATHTENQINPCLF